MWLGGPARTAPGRAADVRADLGVGDDVVDQSEVHRGHQRPAVADGRDVQLARVELDQDHTGLGQSPAAIPFAYPSGMTVIDAAPGRRCQPGPHPESRPGRSPPAAPSVQTVCRTRSGLRQRAELRAAVRTGASARGAVASRTQCAASQPERRLQDRPGRWPTPMSAKSRWIRRARVQNLVEPSSLVAVVLFLDLDFFFGVSNHLDPDHRRRCRGRASDRPS